MEKTIIKDDYAAWLESPVTQKIQKFCRRQSLLRLVAEREEHDLKAIFNARGYAHAMQDVGTIDIEMLDTINEILLENFEEVY